VTVLVAGRCPECGLDLDAIQPPDAVVAVRSLPRRWQGALAKAGDDEDTEAVLRRRPAGGGPSALEHACRVVVALMLLERHARRALVEDKPDLAPADVPAGEIEACAGRSPEAVLGGLTAAAEALAATLDGVASDAWLRPATLAGAATDVQGLTRAAVHEGTHHLREAEQVLREVRGRRD
jgi:hypothetical protein